MASNAFGTVTQYANCRDMALGCLTRSSTNHVLVLNDAAPWRKLVGGSMSYSTPVQAVRGCQQFLYDQYGQCYLEAYNNVPHVGHCHPHVVEAVSKQLSTLSCESLPSVGGQLVYPKGYLKTRLQETIGTHDLVGDVRGMGLFLGIEFVTDKATKEPATLQASYIKNRLHHFGVLVGTDGSYDSVLKIRPPSPFNCDDADYLVDKLTHVLNDTVLQQV